MKCIVDFIKPCNRFEVYKLTDDGHRTLIHCAAYHHHFKVIDFVLRSLSSSEEQLKLLLIKNTSGLTALDYSVRKEVLNIHMRATLFCGLTEEQQNVLVNASDTYQQYIVNNTMAVEDDCPCK